MTARIVDALMLCWRYYWFPVTRYRIVGFLVLLMSFDILASVDAFCERVQVGDAKKNAKKRVADKLLSIEKDILRKALAAVQELINELPNSAISPCVGPYLPNLKWLLWEAVECSIEINCNRYLTWLFPVLCLGMSTAVSGICKKVPEP